MTIETDDLQGNAEIENTPADLNKSWGRCGDDFDLPGVYRVPEFKLEDLEAKLAKLNKRAAKLGLAPIALNRLGNVKELVYKNQRVEGSWETRPVPTGEVKIYTCITIEGERPLLDGWELAAGLEHLGEAGNLLRVVPTFKGEIPVEYRSNPQRCDHCQVRRRRNDTFVLRHENGEFKQIGRSCLQDFLPRSSVAQLAAWAEILWAADCACASEEDSESGEGGGSVTYLVPVTFLSYVCAAIRAEGWISAKKARESDGSLSSTAGTALHVQFPSPRSHIKPEYKPTDADRAEAAKALEFAEEFFQDEANTKSDYEYNLSVLLKVPHWKAGRHTGLGASLIPFVQRALGRAAELKHAKATSNHVGVEGTRAILTLKVVGHQEWEGQFGVTHFYKFIEGEGNVVVWKASGALDRPVPTGNPEAPWTRSSYSDKFVEIGETVELLCTIKEHSEYKGIKQTIVNRGDVLVGELIEQERAKLAKKAAAAAKKAAKLAAKIAP